MTKVTVYRYFIRLGLGLGLLFLHSMVHSQFTLHIRPVDKDSAQVKKLGLQQVFAAKKEGELYISRLPAILANKGFPAASVDSVFYDSTRATAVVYFGETFHFAVINTDSVDPFLLRATRWETLYKKKGLTLQQWQVVRGHLLDELENNGYPFGGIELDSVRLEKGALYGNLIIQKGPRYKIDSIRNFGEAKISSSFLQYHLGILNGSYYKKEKLQSISRKLAELPYVQEQRPFDLTMLGTGSILNLYLKPKKSSQVNVLVGLLPASEQFGSTKLMVTGEALINLRNALGNGETIGLNWQQLQVKSPRLNILFQQPFLFNSPFGVHVNFDLFKKDSSYVNISLQTGVQYALSSNQSGSVFFQHIRSNLLTVDTFLVKNNRRLPQEADVTSANVGVNYDWYNTDFRLSPRKGNEFQASASVGTKNIRKNNVIIRLHDESDPSFDFNALYDTLTLRAYQFRFKLSAAHYFSLTRVSSLKTSLTGALFQSPNIFRNELFQIGGYKLLRGFDEESIFASRYAVAGLEYRYFLGLNSFLFAFTDAGFAYNALQQNKKSNSFLGAGMGMAFETKAGIFNISYAVGKRGSEKLNFRQSKIHLGYVNYF